MTETAPRRVLAVASAGGHFHQLTRLFPGLEGHRILTLTTLPGLAAEFGVAPAALIPDCNANTPLRALGCLAVLGARMIRFRPHVVVTTGALPGVLAIAWGRVLGARTIWIDSVANAETLSASGKLARRIAHLTLSQWPTVAQAERVRYEGAVL